MDKEKVLTADSDPVHETEFEEFTVEDLLTENVSDHVCTCTVIFKLYIFHLKSNFTYCALHYNHLIQVIIEFHLLSIF